MSLETGIYRPVINRETAQALMYVIRAGMENVSLTQTEAKNVLLFLNKITEREQMAQVMERLGKTLPDLVEQTPEEKVDKVPFQISQNEHAALNRQREEQASMLAEWDDEALEHFIWVHPEQADIAQLVQEEIAKRVREREQSPTKTHPPNSTDESA